MSGCGVLDGLKDCLDDVLSIPGDLGLRLHQVFQVTRTWQGPMVGDGSFTDEVVEVLPQPGIKDFTHSVRVLEGGSIKQGDLILTGVSKNAYPEESDVDLKSADHVEKFYRVGCNDYRVVSVKENLLTWDIQVRRLSDQTRRS